MPALFKDYRQPERSPAAFSRRTLKFIGTALAAGMIGCGMLVILAVLLVDSGRFKAAVLQAISTRAGRPVSAATLELVILSLHPRAVATGVVIGNPAWMPQGQAAEVAKLTLVLDLPGFNHPSNIAKLTLDDATLHLARDGAGRSNWQWAAPDRPSLSSKRLLRNLSMQHAHVELDDQRRHLKFRGVVSAGEAIKGGSPLLVIEGNGDLNGREVHFDITADALASARRDTPYHFSFAERSSGSRVSGDGSLPRPFDFSLLDAGFTAAGADLKDLYFLTGVTLIHTGSYALKGKFARRGARTTFSELTANSGQSDMHGSVSIDATGDRAQLRAELNSTLLRLSDLGAQAAGRATERDVNKALLLSNAGFTPNAARHVDAVVNFNGAQVQVGRVSLQAVRVQMTLNHGVIIIDPLQADVLEGRLHARVRIDASKDEPPTEVDLSVSDARLGLFLRKGAAPAPMDGLVRARILINGHGSSVHQVASSANGTVTAVVSHGTLRSSLAELTGIDLRGVGLMLAKSTQETGVPCGVASFRAENGTLAAQRLVLDTDAVLINGEGAIHLDSESLDLEIRGSPKKLRLLRVRAPIFVRGTLSHPTVGIHAGNTAQTAETAESSALVTPLASMLAFVDPGLAKDASCAALAAQPTT